MKKEVIRCPELQDQTVENLQDVIIQAGGKFFRKQELLDMTFFELMNGLIPNGIEFSFKYQRPKKEYRSMSLKEAIDAHEEDLEFIKSL